MPIYKHDPIELKVICWLLLWPCLLPGQIRWWIRKLRNHGPPLEPALRPLKSKLKDGWSSKRVDDQQQCMLFKILPQDVRLMIWTIVLGREDADDVIHLDLGRGTVLSRRCLKEGQLNELGFKHLCWEIAWLKEDRRRYRQVLTIKDPRTLLPLVRTCKQIYNESIHILYGANTFDIRRAECILRLPKVISTLNLHSIRSLQFSAAFHYPVLTSAPAKSKIVKTWCLYRPDDPAKWPKACTVLSSMSLTHLSITIALWVHQPKWGDFDDDVEGSIFNILQPLTYIRVSNFNLALTADVPQAVLSRLGALPFTITKDDTPDAGFEYGIHLTFRPPGY